jgi:hypothetical protein
MLLKMANISNLEKYATKDSYKHSYINQKMFHKMVETLCTYKSEDALHNAKNSMQSCKLLALKK